MTRTITVTTNTYTDATLSGYNVRVTLNYNSGHSTALTLSRDEAEKLADMLDHYLTENP